MNLLGQDHCILDAGFFVIARGYYPDTFPSFWEKMSTAVNGGIISSVQEVREEIEGYGGEQQYLTDWVSEHPGIFNFPNKAEQDKITEIMTSFPHALSKKKQHENEPWADPFVIARAWEQGATVVTTERSAKDKYGNVQNPQKIPDICKKLEVRCITPQEFMKEQEWKF